MTTATRQRLEDLIDDALTEGLDTTATIADHIVGRMSRAQLAELATANMGQLVRARLRRMRRMAVGGERDGRAAPTSSRWRQVALDYATFQVDGHVRALPTLTADECDFVAQDYDERAEANRRWAQAMRDLAHMMREAGAERVGDLDEDAVRAVLPHAGQS